jgi:hypothetical protein
MFLSLALVAQTAMSVYIPLFGQNGMRVGVAGIFAAMPAILFGPFYGAMVYGLSDALGYLLRPTGAYLPLMTIIMAAGGFARGALWRWLRGKNNAAMRTCVAAAAFLFLALGLHNAYALNADGVNRYFYDGYMVDGTLDATRLSTADMRGVSRMVISRTVSTANPAGNLATHIMFMTAGLLGSGVFGCFLLLADWALVKFFIKKAAESRIMPLFLSMVTGGVMVTTLNTVLLRETIFESWKLLPFTVIWLPRVIETVVSHTVYVYFIALILGVFEKQRSLNDWIS